MFHTMTALPHSHFFKNEFIKKLLNRRYEIFVTKYYKF